MDTYYYKKTSYLIYRTSVESKQCYFLNLVVILFYLTWYVLHFHLKLHEQNRVIQLIVTYFNIFDHRLLSTWKLKIVKS